MNRHAPLALGIALLGLALARPAAARGQMRTYLDWQDTILSASPTGASPSLALFVREESRFETEGLVLLKTSAGVRAGLLPWLSTAAYYAHRDLLSGARAQKHMAVGDLTVHLGLGPLHAAQRNEFEWHATDAFFRYRSQLKLTWATPLAPLSLWGAAELRVDADAARLDMYDLLAGAAVRLSQTLRLCPFYGYEANRRGRPRWSGTHFAGLLLSARF